MTATTIAKPGPAAAAAKGGARVVPAGSTAAAANFAASAAERIGTVLKSATARGNACIVEAYGADIDRAALSLAKRAADEAAGGAKSRGGARANVLTVLDIVKDATATAATADRVYVSAARSVLDTLAAAKRERTERKRALADTVNDTAAPASARTAALEVLAGMQTADNDAKRAAARQHFADAVKRAADAGIDAAELASLVAAHFAPSGI